MAGNGTVQTDGECNGLRGSITAPEGTSWAEKQVSPDFLFSLEGGATDQPRLSGSIEGGERAPPRPWDNIEGRATAPPDLFHYSDGRAVAALKHPVFVDRGEPALYSPMFECG